MTIMSYTIAVHSAFAARKLGYGAWGCGEDSEWRASVDAEVVSRAECYENVLRFCHGHGLDVELSVDIVVHHNDCCKWENGRIDMVSYLLVLRGEGC